MPTEKKRISLIQARASSCPIHIHIIYTYATYTHHNNNENTMSLGGRAGEGRTGEEFEE